MKKRKRSHRVKMLDFTITTLRKEMHSPYCKSLGRAAIKSVSETLAVTRAERARVIRAEKRKK